MELVVRGADGHSVVVAVRPIGRLDVAVAELIERCAFPVGALATVDGQLAPPIADRVHRSGEPSTRTDLGELVMVADQDDLGACATGLRDEPIELQGADHRGLVDDHDMPVRQQGRSMTMEPGQRERLDACAR